MMMLRDASSHKEALRLMPLSGVERAPSRHGSPGTGWIAHTGRAEFEVVGLERFRGQWIRMRFRLQVDRDEWSWPRLSFDLGTSDFDACAIPFPRATQDRRISSLSSMFPANLRAARLRPIARPGRFKLDTATVQVIGKVTCGRPNAAHYAATDGTVEPARC